MDIDTLISYWRNGSDEELLNAEVMFNNNRLLPALYFCHLGVEKILKALVVKHTREHAPKTHKLSWLADLANLSFNDEQKVLLAVLTEYQLEGRYPEKYPDIPSTAEAKTYFEQTKILQAWLKQMC